jgi:hypothetical protein
LFYYDDTGATPAGNQIYRHDNTVVNSFGMRIDDQGSELAYNPNVAAPPSQAPLAGVAPVPSSTVEDLVKANAGARPADRDQVDARIVGYVSSRGGPGYIRTQDQVGGYPALAVNRRTLALPADPHGVTGGGYTNLELWLHGHSALVEGQSTGSEPAVTPPAPPTGLRLIVS